MLTPVNRQLTLLVGVKPGSGGGFRSIGEPGPQGPVGPAGTSFPAFNRDVKTANYTAVTGDFAGNKRLALLTPATAWNGTISALADNDSGSNVFSDVSGQRESWNPTSYGGGAGSIHAVVAKVHGDSEGSALTKIGQYIRKGGVNYDGTDTTIEPTVGNMEVWYVDPATSVGWVNTDLASIEVGLKSAP